MKDPFATPKKRSGKWKVIVTVALVIILFVCSVLAVNWIFGNVVPIQVGSYSFQNSMVVDDATPYQYQNVTFSGTLYYDGSPVASGYTIALFMNDTQVASSLTDSNGQFAIEYNVTVTGNFDAKPGYLPT